MNVLVTGSSGHLGEGLMRTLAATAHRATGLDVLPSALTAVRGSILDRELVRAALRGVDAVIHTATLHKPHVATHPQQAFVDVNVTGTLVLLEAAVAAGVRAFVFTSTTSAFGAALTPPPGAAAAWITEDVQPIARNIYGTTKVAAEHLCELFARRDGLPCLVLRTSRFFPEADDDPDVRDAHADGNVKANEYLYRRVDLQDAVDAHLLAVEKAPTVPFGRYIVSATTPFRREDVGALRASAPEVVARRAPGYEREYARRGWRMFPGIDRVYDNARARRDLGWEPRWDFRRVLQCLEADTDPRSELARSVGSKGYHR